MDKDQEEFIRAVKDAKKMQVNQRFEGLLRSFGKAFPKGIRHPDALVTNKHLYFPGAKGGTKLR
jgi:hypothetical protein